MDVLESLEAAARRTPTATAHRTDGLALDYGSLWQRSGHLAAALDALGERGRPVVVLGHKDPTMLVCFLGCVRSGHPYVPLDVTIPPARLGDILDVADPLAVLVPEQLPAELLPTLEGRPVWDRQRLEQAVDEHGIPSERWVGAEDPFYVIFTSGSTGAPKGVQVPRRALDNFVAWGLSLRHDDGVDTGPDEQAVYLNQAPFSFDLSVFDLWLSLASGATLVSLDKETIAQRPRLSEALASSGVTTWVSTPSFARLCLADPAFGREMLPHLELFLFCGETLDNSTARALLERFPGCSVLNTYGPTESTVAVTAVNCTPELLDRHPVLPVGAPRPGTRLLVRDADGRELPEGSSGEVVIAGDTVALGYLGRPDLTAAAFERVEGVPAYRTGDRGRLAEGQLWFEGRLDFQVKLHGYRIELEDIEENLRRLPHVEQAVVVPVADASGTVGHLVAVLQCDDGLPASPLRRSLDDRALLRERVPQYMVPKAFRYVERIPLTANGKVDRAAVRRLAT